MANNFHEAGLDLLLATEGVFDKAEKATLTWLQSAARESSAIYWDQLRTIPPGSPFDLQIRNIKAKCRQLGLHEQFEGLQRQFADRRMAA